MLMDGPLLNVSWRVLSISLPKLAKEIYAREPSVNWLIDNNIIIMQVSSQVQQPSLPPQQPDVVGTKNSAAEVVMDVASPKTTQVCFCSLACCGLQVLFLEYSYAMRVPTFFTTSSFPYLTFTPTILPTQLPLYTLMEPSSQLPVFISYLLPVTAKPVKICCSIRFSMIWWRLI